jgi:hypothetical protein
MKIKLFNQKGEFIRFASNEELGKIKIYCFANQHDIPCFINKFDYTDNKTSEVYAVATEFQLAKLKSKLPNPSEAEQVKSREYYRILASYLIRRYGETIKVEKYAGTISEVSVIKEDHKCIPLLKHILSKKAGYDKYDSDGEYVIEKGVRVGFLTKGSMITAPQGYLFVGLNALN